jgi:hypothetical protein
VQLARDEQRRKNVVKAPAKPMTLGSIKRQREKDKGREDGTGGSSPRLGGSAAGKATPLDAFGLAD